MDQRRWPCAPGGGRADMRIPTGGFLLDGPWPRGRSLPRVPASSFRPTFFRSLFPCLVPPSLIVRPPSGSTHPEGPSSPRAIGRPRPHAIITAWWLGQYQGFLHSPLLVVKFLALPSMLSRRLLLPLLFCVFVGPLVGRRIWYPRVTDVPVTSRMAPSSLHGYLYSLIPPIRRPT